MKSAVLPQFGAPTSAIRRVSSRKVARHTASGRSSRTSTAWARAVAAQTRGADADRDRIAAGRISWMTSICSPGTNPISSSRRTTVDPATSPIRTPARRRSRPTSPCRDHLCEAMPGIACKRLHRPPSVNMPVTQESIAALAEFQMRITRNCIEDSADRPAVPVGLSQTVTLRSVSTAPRLCSETRPGRS